MTATDLHERGEHAPRIHREVLERSIKTWSPDDLRIYAQHAALVADVHEAEIGSLKELIRALVSAGKAVEGHGQRLFAAMILLDKVLGAMREAPTRKQRVELEASLGDALKEAVAAGMPLMPWPDLEAVR